MIHQNRCKIFTLLISILLVCVFCFAAGAEEEGITIDEKYFPDRVFREEILTYDYDSNNILSTSEVKDIKMLHLANRNVESLQGVEYLTELSDLTCDANKLKVLDVSKNTKLKELSCGNNELKELDLSNNTKLTYL